jgi:SpoVK/Ycf46/Vps4 family AAA+-type ATPase
VTPGEVAAVARHGVQTADEAGRLVREHARRHVGDLAEVMECPFRWDDLVIHESLQRTLEELLFEAQSRPAFWEGDAARRLFPGGRGLLALFSGPPGTGKTMAAQVIAASLGVDLVRIDLSSVISKYVGETSQNLERVLARAARMDVVLLFDEADALFGRRTEVQDAHDRFANTDTSYLLQAIEQYPGVALLATNRKGDIDPAFIRRFRYVAEFRRPDAAERRRIWERVLDELVGAARVRALAPGLEGVATDVEATGAQIKFAVLSALFAAQRAGVPVALPHLVRGLERELLKEGRTLSAREQERLLRHAR